MRELGHEHEVTGIGGGDQVRDLAQQVHQSRVEGGLGALLRLLRLRQRLRHGFGRLPKRRQVHVVLAHLCELKQQLLLRRPDVQALHPCTVFLHEPQVLKALHKARMLRKGRVQVVVLQHPLYVRRRDVTERLLITADDDGCPVCNPREAPVAQLLHHIGHERVVEGLSLLGQRDLQPFVDLLELNTRHLAQSGPSRQVVLVSTLQRHHLLVGAGLELLVRVEPLLRLLVEADQVRDRRGRRLEVGEGVLQVRDQHPELRPPVPDVVHADNLVAAELERAAEALPNDRGPQVPNVHLLRDVWGREVDKDSLLSLPRRLKSVLEHAVQLLLDVVLVDLDVDEALRGHVCSLDHSAARQILDDALPNLLWAPGGVRDTRVLEHLRQCHCVVALILALLDVTARGDGRFYRHPKGGKRGLDGVVEELR
mmetsp:Transcript_62925/g.103843  ORF Transcript_62925/g.103843 Transcript_62925/m.103843 type:complete len:425 (-) Transcript_62925:431-1705(-)